MAGISVAPSQSFWGRMGQNLPNMLNAAGSQFGGNMSGAARSAGALNRPAAGVGPGRGFAFGRRGSGVPNTASGGGTAPGTQTQTQNGPGGMPPQGPSPHDSMGSGGGIVRMPNIQFGGMPLIGAGDTSGMGMGGGMGFRFRPGQNTGITGGMFPGGIRPQLGGSDMPQVPGGGLWGAYNNLSNEQGVPNRQLFY